MKKRGRLLRAFLFIFVNFLMACSSDGLFGSKTTPKPSSASNGVKPDLLCDDLITAANIKYTAAQTATLALLEDGQNPFLEAARQNLQSKIQDNIEVRPDVTSYIVSGTGSEHVEFSYFVNDLKFCSNSSKASRIKTKIYTVAHPPPFLPNDSIDNIMQLTWGDPEKNIPDLIKKLEIHDPKISNIKAQKCVMLHGDVGKAAYEMNFDLNGDPYTGFASNNEVFSVGPAFFDAVKTDGEVRVYVKTPSDSPNVVLDVFTLSGMSGGGSLCNEKLKVQEPTGASKAFSLKNEFLYEPGDYRFNQASVFANATAHAEWIMRLPAALGVWHPPFIIIKLNGANKGINNRAIYIPPSSTAKTASIELGQGNADQLINLQYDADVISHEMGHHIIYRTLKNATGAQAVVIHEALADYFVFARTNNSCLGETICPSTKICINTQCLRNAQNSMNFMDEDLPTEPHLRSQLLSGLLWDLGIGLTHVKVANIIYQSVNFFSRDTGYLELLTALMKADVDLYGGVNACTIKNAADNRGFKELLSEIKCDEFK